MDFIVDIEEIRKRARRHIEDGLHTQDYGLDRDQVVKILNDALATEYLCVLRNRFHYFHGDGDSFYCRGERLLQHAQEEQDHADQIAERIKQWGGKSELHPSAIAEHSHSDYREGTCLTDMIREDLIAERIAIEMYREMMRYFGDKDPTSRIMMQGILANEEEYADELADLLFAVQPDTNESSKRLYFSSEVPGNAEIEKVRS